MKTLDNLFMEAFLDIQLCIYGYDINGKRWILNQYVRNNVARLFTISNIAFLLGYITEQDRNRINNMVLAACDRMLQDLDQEVDNG